MCVWGGGRVLAVIAAAYVKTPPCSVGPTPPPPPPSGRQLDQGLERSISCAALPARTALATYGTGSQRQRRLKAAQREEREEQSKGRPGVRQRVGHLRPSRAVCVLL